MLMLLFALALSLLITAAAVPLVIKLAKKFGLLDNPKIRPHPAHTQDRVVPRGGGIAIFAGIFFSTLLLLPLTKALIGIFLGITILLVMGIIDDKLPKFNPYLRLILLSMAALAAVGSGIGITFIANPFPSQSLFPMFTGQIIYLDQITWSFNLFGPHKIIILADVFAFLWIITLTQVINWSKGVDGQMPGITAVTGLTLGLLAYKFYIQGDTNQLPIALLSFIVVGTSLGFLIFNWHPAKIFPGFSGSTILAFMIACISILSSAKVATALLVLAVPAVDFLYIFFKRIFSGKSPVWGDRSHLHHTLLDLGWSQPKISLFYILASVILGSIALSLGTDSKIFAIAIVAIIFSGFILWLNSFGESSKP